MPVTPSPLRRQLEEHGYVVVPNVLPKENLEAVGADIWRHTGADPHERETWYQLEHIGYADMISMYHYQSMWDARSSINAQCPLTNFATADYSITATMDNDLFLFLKTRGAAALEQAASSARTQITQAQNNVSTYQQQVNTLNGQIVTETAIIQTERTQAQQALQNAQSNVNNIQSTIDANQRAIDELNREIADLESDTRAHPWLFAKNGALITEKGLEIGGHKTAIGSEKGALATATVTLNSSRSAIVVTPIAADPRVASLYAALQGATLSLQGANSILEGIKQANGRLASVVGWVAQHGEDNLLIVTHASFAGQLSQVSGGRVSMAIDLTLMGQPYHLNQDFNFHDVEQTATLFVEQLKCLI